MEKTIESIYSEMLEVFGAASGYLPSSSCDLAARLYAAAAQIQGLYLQAQWLLDQSFPQTAAGEYLDRHAQLRGISRSVATCAAGKLRFGLSMAVSGNLSIKAGTVCMTKDGIRFATTDDAVLRAGALYVDVPAMALEPGRQGNAAANTVTIMAAMPVGVKACTNPEAFSGGEDQESDEGLRQRLLDSYRRLPNGANAAYYEQTALSRNGVAAAVAVRCPRGVGTVDLYVATDAGIPDAALLSELNGYLQEKREISVNLRVLAPTARALNIQVKIQPAAGYSFETARADVDKVLRATFTGGMLGKEVTLAFLGNLLYSLDSVQNYHFSSPTADIPASPTVLPRLGKVTISPWEA
ncbi:MAG: baseplate J/gp47 family protein [Oscillospiraceae bacterium]|nr:baseplate J/gp47 family protein [Oscillospiraceae bacterium]